MGPSLSCKQPSRLIRDQYHSSVHAYIVFILICQLLHRCNKLCIAHDELTKVVCKTKESLHAMLALGHRPVLDNRHLSRIYLNAFSTDDVAKEFQLRPSDWANLQLDSLAYSFCSRSNSSTILRCSMCSSSLRLEMPGRLAQMFQSHLSIHHS